MRQTPVNTPEGCMGTGLDIRWQQGPYTMVDGRQTANGSGVEQVIKAAIERLTYLDSRLPSPHSRNAIDHLYMALSDLESRTRDRARRGVMGTDQP